MVIRLQGVNRHDTSLPAPGGLKMTRYNARTNIDIEGDRMEIVVDFAGDKKINAEFKGFKLETDQSEKSGGGGTAPEPFDLFLASIATCAGYYVLDFCATRDILTGGLRLFLRTERDEEKKMLGKISIDIHLPDRFPEKYKTAVVRAAEACSVKKLMFAPPLFEIRAVEAPAAGKATDGTQI
jgi:putative redox protein